MIKNIVFDMGRVLVRSYWKECMQIKGKSKTEQTRVKEMAMESHQWEQMDLGLISLEEYKQSIAGQNKNKIKEINEFFEAYSSFTFVDAEMEELIRKLKQENYNIYILSNYGKELFEDLEKKFDFLNYVNGKIISYEVNAKKPDRKIYLELINKYQLDPAESIFIDDKEENIQTAKLMEFKTILFENINQMKRELQILCRD